MVRYPSVKGQVESGAWKEPALQLDLFIAESSPTKMDAALIVLDDLGKSQSLRRTGDSRQNDYPFSDVIIPDFQPANDIRTSSDQDS